MLKNVLNVEYSQMSIDFILFFLKITFKCISFGVLINISKIVAEMTWSKGKNMHWFGAYNRTQIILHLSDRCANPSSTWINSRKQEKYANPYPRGAEQHLCEYDCKSSHIENVQCQIRVTKQPKVKAAFKLT